MNMGRKKAIATNEFTPEVYKAAATEHLPVAAELYESGRYVLAAYVSGLAVESMFRAYRVSIDAEFNARHDLNELSVQARFRTIVPESKYFLYSEWLTIVAARWSSTHRYRSYQAMTRWLKRLKLDRGIRGDPVKENARRLVNAATGIVSLGVEQWPHLHRS